MRPYFLPQLSPEPPWDPSLNASLSIALRSWTWTWGECGTLHLAPHRCDTPNSHGSFVAVQGRPGGPVSPDAGILCSGRGRG